jgi:hypothetical protein
MREKTSQHQLRLSDRTWSLLLAIAEREGLLYGGIPSRAEAVRWLVEHDLSERTETPRPRE